MLIASEAEQALELATVEPDDNFVPDEDDGHRRPPRPSQQLRAGGRILGDVLRLERDTLLRKKLFRQVAAASASRPVDRDLSILHHDSVWVVHRIAPQRRCPAAAVSASVSMRPVRGAFTSHFLRCSTEQKKLMSGHV